MEARNGTALSEIKCKKAQLVSIDNPNKNGGVGGKHTHIRLLLNGLNRLGVEASCASPPDDLTFKVLHLLPGHLARRSIGSKDERYCHWLTQFRKGLQKNLMSTKFDFQVCNPQDVIAHLDAVKMAKNRDREIRTVLTLHGYYTDEMVSVGSVNKDSSTALRMKKAEVHAYEDADRIVCVDNRIMKYVKETAAPKNDISVIPNAIDVDRFKPIEPSDMLVLRHRLNFHEKDRIIICARRLVPKNGVEHMVMAMPEILRHVPDAILVVAGDGPQKKEIEIRIRELDISSHVRMLGSLPHTEMLGYTQVANVEVVPSVISSNVEEATSLAMLEGMACRKPLVVSMIGGLKETIIDASTGLFTEQANPRDIADKVILVLSDDDLSRTLGANAREYVVKNHSHVNHAKRFIEQYTLAME
jgi:glycogen synthase